VGAYGRTGQRARQMRVVPAEVLKRLYARSDRHGLVQTAGHLALLVAGGWLVLATRGTWWVAPALLLQGLFVNALFGAMHEIGALRLVQDALDGRRAGLPVRGGDPEQCRLLPALPHGPSPLHPGSCPRSRARHLRHAQDMGRLAVSR